MKRLLLLLLLIVVLMMSGCRNGQPENTVFSAGDVMGKRIGVLSGSSSPRYAQEAGEAVIYATPADLIAALKSGAVDCVFMEPLPAEAIIKQTSGLKILNDAYAECPLSFVIAKENADLTRDVNNALAALAENGTIKGFSDKHLLGKTYTYTPPDVAKREVTLKAAVPDGYPPYSYKDENGTFTGLEIDIARAVCDMLGLNLETVETDHSELITLVSFGRADFALGTLYDNEQDREITDFSDSFVTLSQVIIVRR